MSTPPWAGFYSSWRSAPDASQISSPDKLLDGRKQQQQQTDAEDEQPTSEWLELTSPSFVIAKNDDDAAVVCRRRTDIQNSAVDLRLPHSLFYASSRQ